MHGNIIDGINQISAMRERPPLQAQINATSVLEQSSQAGSTQTGPLSVHCSPLMKTSCPGGTAAGVWAGWVS